MKNQPHPSFFEAFGEHINEIVVKALSAAYDTACDAHDPSSGYNALTFGFNLYQFAVFEIARRAEEAEEVLRRVNSGSSFRMKAGEWRFGCYRVGRSQHENIATSFPRNDGAAGALVEPLWLPELEPDLSKSRTAVLAHFGNSNDGFCAAYWAIPTRTEKDKITEWGYWQPIWSQEIPEAQNADGDAFHPEEEIVVAQPIRRKQTALADDRE